MKKLIFLILIFGLSCSCSLAQDDSKEESLPAGMEKIKVGRGSEVIVPAGTKTHKVGDLVVLENPGEYVARRIAEMEERMGNIESQQRELNSKIERLEAQLKAAQKPSSLKSTEKENK